MNFRRPRSVYALTAIIVAMGFAVPAFADLVENRLEGEVTVTGASAPVVEALAAIGVVDGARATIVLEIEDETFGIPTFEDTQYSNLVTRWTIAIGQFRLAAREFGNGVRVNDGPGNGVDLYTASATMDPTLVAFGPAAGAIMLLVDANGDAIADEGAGQNLSRFTAGSLSVEGDGAELEIVFFEDLPPLPACVSGQIRSAADYCRAVLRCLSSQAKDPEGAGLAACLSAAEAEFAEGFDNASAGGGFCRATVDGAGAVDLLANDAEPLESLVNEFADLGSSADRTYRSRLLKASSDSVETSLKLYSKDAKKPNAKKLEKKLKKNRKNLKKQVKKSAKKAGKSGVVPDVSVKDLARQVDVLVDSVLDVANGL